MGKETPPVELSAALSHTWADPIGIDAATLRAAQQSPEKYRDLIVRVAGYSDYFCNLSEALQDEIIARTDHDSF